MGSLCLHPPTSVLGSTHRAEPHPEHRDPPNSSSPPPNPLCFSHLISLFMFSLQGRCSTLGSDLLLGFGACPSPPSLWFGSFVLRPFLSFCFLFFPFRQPQQPIPKHSRGAAAAPRRRPDPSLRTLLFRKATSPGLKICRIFGGIFVSFLCSFSFIWGFFFSCAGTFLPGSEQRC